MTDSARKTIETMFENEVYKVSVKWFAKKGNDHRAAAQRVAQMAVLGLRSRRVETQPS